jgi:Flp pilus assembly pilin Flp
MSEHRNTERWQRVLVTLANRAKRAVGVRGRTRPAARGQGMAEYALIAVLVSLAIAAIITVTGPTIGNIFSNTVYNLLGQKFTPDATLSEGEKLVIQGQLDGLDFPPPTYLTNTPLVPTQLGAPGVYCPTKPVTPPQVAGTWDTSAACPAP